MSLFDLFFRDSYAASQRRTADEAARANELRAVAVGSRQLQLQRRVAQLEQDVGALALVVASILKKLDEKGQVTRDEVKEVIKKLDLLDKVADGKITVEDLGRGDFYEKT